MSKTKQPPQLRAYIPTRAKRPKAAGLYVNVPFEEYLRWDAINNSSLHAMVHGSPGEYRWALENPKEQTPVLRLGRLCHEGRLEPSKLLQRYWVLDEQAAVDRVMDEAKASGKEVKSPKATKRYKELVAEQEAANPGKERITQEELDIIVGLACRLVDDPVTWRLLNGAALEVSWLRKTKIANKVVWLKGRIDIVCPSAELADFKTIRDTDDRTIAQSIDTFGYHRQAAFYRWAFAELYDGELRDFWAIFGRKDRGFEVRAAPIHPDDLALGHEQWTKAVEQIVKCEKSGQWPWRQHPPAFRLPEYRQQQTPITIDGEQVI